MSDLYRRYSWPGLSINSSNEYKWITNIDNPVTLEMLSMSYVVRHECNRNNEKWVPTDYELLWWMGSESLKLFTRRPTSDINGAFLYPQYNIWYHVPIGHDTFHHCIAVGPTISVPFYSTEGTDLHPAIKYIGLYNTAKKRGPTFDEMIVKRMIDIVSTVGYDNPMRANPIISMNAETIYRRNEKGLYHTIHYETFMENIRSFIREILQSKNGESQIVAMENLIMYSTLFGIDVADNMPENMVALYSAAMKNIYDGSGGVSTDAAEVQS